MSPTNQLILFLALFLVQHFAMSHPLRASMVAKMGEKGFQATYSILSLLTFIPAIIIYQGIAPGESYWAIGPVIWWLATVLMWLGSVLFVGSFVGNPALPQSGAGQMAAREPRGVFRITRHPMMWGFALWAIVHMMVAPRQEVFILCGALLFLALAGAKGQDKKKQAQLGADWHQWQRATSFVPFGKGVVSPGTTWLLAGTAFWLIATYLHPLAGGPEAGIYAYF